MPQRIKHIWNRTLTHRSEVACIYLFQLVCGIVIGCITFSTIDNTIGQSMALHHLTSGFDRTVFMDMINNNEGVLSPISFWAMALVLIYLLISILLQGGFIYNIRKGEIGYQSQLRNGLNNILPFLGYAFLSVLMALVSLIAIGLIFKGVVGDPLTTFSSEKPFVISFFIAVIFYSIIITLIWGWSIATRMFYIDSSSFGTSIRSGFIFIKTHLISVLLIGFLLLGVHLLLAIIYYLIMEDRGAPSWLIVFIGIVIQQVFSFAKVYIRSWGYIAIDQIEDKFIG